MSFEDEMEAALTGVDLSAGDAEGGGGLDDVDDLIQELGVSGGSSPLAQTPRRPQQQPAGMPVRAQPISARVEDSTRTAGEIDLDMEIEALDL